jgi:stage III sporulation protein AG
MDKQFDCENFIPVNTIKKTSNETIYNKTMPLNNDVDIGNSDKNTVQTTAVDLNVKTNENEEIAKVVEKKPDNLLKIGAFLKNFQFSKLFSSKLNKVAVLVVLLAIVLVLFLNLSSSDESSTTTTATTYNSLEYVSSKAYVENLEDKLVAVLSKIKDAGDVTVMITLESGPELKIATSVDERTNTSTSGSNTTSSVTVVENPIIITQNGESSPLVLMEIMPVIKGVVVVAEGAGNVKVKLQLLEAVQSLLEISNNNIQIYAGI